MEYCKNPNPVRFSKQKLLFFNHHSKIPLFQYSSCFQHIAPPSRLPTSEPAEIIQPFFFFRQELPAEQTSGFSVLLHPFRIQETMRPSLLQGKKRP
jgi:hypothetical protein